MSSRHKIEDPEKWTKTDRKRFARTERRQAKTILLKSDAGHDVPSGQVSRIGHPQAEEKVTIKRNWPKSGVTKKHWKSKFWKRRKQDRHNRNALWDLSES